MLGLSIMENTVVYVISIQNDELAIYDRYGNKVNVPMDVIVG